MTTLPLSWRVQHTSDTSGTGTLALNPAAANRRSLFAASGGVAQPVGMVMAVPGTNQFEVGVPTYNGGNPGTLARGTPLFSSNGGAAVSFSGVIDCFPFDFPGQRRRASFPTTSTAGLSELGCFQTMTGSTNGTLNLPAVATVPPGAGYLIMNRGTAGAWLTIDPNGSETINGATTLILFAGESCEVFATSSGWLATGLPPVSLVRRQVASASANIDFVLPGGFSRFRLEFDETRPANDGAIITLRTSSDGGATFAATASDYAYVTEATTPPTVSSSDVPTGATSIPLTSQIDTGLAGNSAMGEIRLWAGDGTRRANLMASSGHYHNNLTARSMHRVFGERASATQINAVRLLMDSGNITAGTFTLYAVR
jgi:hypothetical protein